MYAPPVCSRCVAASVALRLASVAWSFFADTHAYVYQDNARLKDLGNGIYSNSQSNHLASHVCIWNRRGPYGSSGKV
ncbi:hypothetical protein SCA6_011620 [Theobroma cacao]